MPSPKLMIALLAATLVAQAPFNEVHADPVPDQTRIVSDIESHHLLVDTSALGAGPVGDGAADSAAIRSSVRKGDVIEFRVTSIYYADSNDEPQREVDSIVRYRMDGNHWALMDVQTERTRHTTPGNPGETGRDC